MTVTNYLDDEVYNDAIEAWGLSAQMGQLVEEAAELIIAIRHWERGRVDFSEVIEEAADTMLMCMQVRYLYPKEFDNILDYKINRTKNKLAARKEN